MAKYTTEILINEPLEFVYKSISNLELAPKWIQGLHKTKLISGEAGKADARINYTFIERGKEILFTETVITVIENKKIASELESKQVRVRTIIDFIPVAENQTKIKIYNDVKGKTFPMKLMLPFLNGMMKKRQLGDFKKFKELVEK